ncbi:hypothetical protein BAUCODRAFT_229790 [Baudoinia panamericana UAMH 10762]|uniref:Uncharacterized protein n=1 Tax=Baudoinia panamericana (strain UAMH 10762) TaxID=717646 RepID=M2M9R0_BAUPA|nr:uncharacterized protein BAUCODRAFT_229790 [Baudoinia panamericana UAMH 10762]EMC93171.1 hypothetical protein BAUCODRAFT_229790 [Baudoinia panamericana UAMH 10762]
MYMPSSSYRRSDQTVMASEKEPKKKGTWCKRLMTRLGKLFRWKRSKITNKAKEVGLTVEKPEVRRTYTPRYAHRDAALSIPVTYGSEDTTNLRERLRQQDWVAEVFETDERARRAKLGYDGSGPARYESLNDAERLAFTSRLSRCMIALQRMPDANGSYTQCPPTHQSCMPGQDCCQPGSSKDAHLLNTLRWLCGNEGQQGPSQPSTKKSAEPPRRGSYIAEMQSNPKMACAARHSRTSFQGQTYSELVAERRRPQYWTHNSRPNVTLTREERWSLSETLRADITNRKSAGMAAYPSGTATTSPNVSCKAAAGNLSKRAIRGDSVQEDRGINGLEHQPAGVPLRLPEAVAETSELPLSKPEDLDKSVPSSIEGPSSSGEVTESSGKTSVASKTPTVATAQTEVSAGGKVKVQLHCAQIARKKNVSADTKPAAIGREGRVSEQIGQLEAAAETCKSRNGMKAATRRSIESWSKTGLGD